MSPTSVPTIDFSPFLSPTSPPTSRLETASSLIAACRTIGFVSLTNHGIPATSVSRAFSWSKRLFDLSESQKQLAPHPPGYKHHRGYSAIGREKITQLLDDHSGEELEAARAVVDQKESFEIGSERNELEPNIWPPGDLLPGFKESMGEFYWECEAAAQRVLAAFALGLGLPEEFFEKLHSGHNNQLRLLHYPPIERELLEKRRVARIGAHTDWGSITILFQDETGGLQVESPAGSGDFVDVKPVEGAMVVNVGDLMQRWSNDTLRSTMHRVDVPKEASGTGDMLKARYSIPYFVAADLDTVVECLPVCVAEGNLKKYEPITQKDYMFMRASMSY